MSLRLSVFFIILMTSLSCTSPQTKEYTSAAGGVLKIPVNWVEVKDLIPGTDLQLSDEEHQRYFVIVSEPRKDLRNKTLERYSHFTRASIRDGLTHPESVGPRTFDINGLPAVQYEISGLSNQERYYYLHTIIEGKEHFHQLIGWTHASKRNENWNMLCQITDSFKEKK